MAEKEYIERGELLQRLSDYNIPCNIDVYYLIKNMPTADVQEVRCGKWIYVAGGFGWADCKCSECGYTDTFEDCTECFYNFCPNCGAKMDKE
ncbi:MAG: hypothetical protein ACI4HN_08295 [Ruminococcus sp.]